MGKWYTKFRTRKFLPGIAFTICTNVPFTVRLQKPVSGTPGWQEAETGLYRIALSVYLFERKLFGIVKLGIFQVSMALDL